MADAVTRRVARANNRRVTASLNFGVAYFMDVIVGTAGHIDHGKTSLVKALTGVDADRLPEEKQRGITIDLGFAELERDGVRIGFVDVPGHERFVKNMLAGASGIDLVLLVVAADEGVMPQTREHFDICRLLRIKSGLIALTKADLADDEMLELARLDIAELVADSFLEHAPVFPVSSRSGAGFDALKAGLIEAAGNVSRNGEIYEPRLAIDRSFSVKGFGAVVTGTLASGEISEGNELELLPVRRTVRVRGIQTHGKAVKTSRTGQRTAINLGGIGHDEIDRGMTLAKPGTLAVTQIFDAEVEVLADAPRALRPRQRIRLHLGTAEVLARISVLNESQTIEPGSRGLVQFRLEAPIAGAYGDRFIIRSYSPQRTIAGGRILDPLAHKHRRSELGKVAPVLHELSAADSGDVAEIFVRMSGDNGMRIGNLRSRTALRTEILAERIKVAQTEKRLVDADGVLVSTDVFERLTKSAAESLEKHHRTDTLSRGMPREILREQVFKRAEPEVFRGVISSLERAGKIVSEQDVVKAASHETRLSSDEQKVSDRLNEIYANAGLEAPKLDDALAKSITGSSLDVRAARRIFQLLINRGDVIAVTSEYYFSRGALDALTTRLRDFATSSGHSTLDVPKFKDIAGVSRKYAIPLLEYFDRTRVTLRVGDKRQIL